MDEQEKIRRECEELSKLHGRLLKEEASMMRRLKNVRNRCTHPNKDYIGNVWVCKDCGLAGTVK